MRITKSIIKDLSIFMIGFGILIGVVFPFFVLLFGVEPSVALSVYFVVSCIFAGASVGVMNILLSKWIIIKRLKVSTDKMSLIEDNLSKAAQGNTNIKCDFETCQLRVESDDEMGMNALAYNRLVETLSLTMSGQELLTRLDPIKISEESLHQILKVTKSAGGAIILEKEGELDLLFSYAIKNPETLINNDIVLNVASSQNPIHMQMPEGVKVDGVLMEVEPKALLIEPLMFNRVRLGIAVLATTENYSDEIKAKARILLRSLSLALNNAIIHEQIRDLAAVDPLTGAFNRRFGADRLGEELSRSNRSRIPLGVMMMDLDHFKSVNDTYGHLAGDKVLVNISKTIRNLLRDGDILIRYGGEEFLILMPGASLKDTREAAEKLRHTIEDMLIKYGEFSIHVTASFGIGSIPEIDLEKESELVAAIDEALYISKKSGRNKVTAVTA